MTSTYSCRERTSKRSRQQQTPLPPGSPRRFQWPGHYLKFELAYGEIDFLSVGLATEPGFTWHDHHGRLVALETPEEVVVKKVRYRSDRFTARDAFDLAAVGTARPGLEKILATEVGDALPRLSESLRVLEARGTDMLRSAIIPIGMGVDLLPRALQTAREIVDGAVHLHGRHCGGRE